MALEHTITGKQNLRTPCSQLKPCRTRRQVRFHEYLIGLFQSNEFDREF